MAIPEPTDDLAAQRIPFRKLRELREQICAADGLPLDTLSMGMSHDLEAAIAEGATIVRIGTPFLVKETTHENSFPSCGGNMANALIGGMVETKLCAASDIDVIDPAPTRAPN